MKYSYKTVSVPVAFLDGWLVNLEKACFGWKKRGKHNEEQEYDEHSTNNYSEYHDGIEWRVTEHVTERKTRLITYQDFYRISPYTYNPIFFIVELLSDIFSYIRRIVMNIVSCVFIPFVILVALFFWTGETSLATGSLQIFLAAYLAFIVLPTVIISLVAFLLRKIFLIDKRVAANLEKDGYEPEW